MSVDVRTTFPAMQNPDLVVELAHQIDERAAHIAATLRDLAAKVEKIAADGGRSLYDLGPAFNKVASEVTNEVSWALANLDLAGLVSRCAEADIAARATKRRLDVG